MRKAIDLYIFFTVIAFVLLLGSSISSYGGIALPSVETGCAKKVNGQFRVWDCASDADCLPSEVCVEVTGVAGPSGADGAACWDTNPDGGNGICDDGEDINDPDGCDVGDCQGPQGDQGPASCPSIIGGYGLLQPGATRLLGYFQDKESNSEL